VTLTDIAPLFIFIGIIIIINYVIIYCFTETKEESPEDNYLIISIIVGVLLIAILVIVKGCLAKYEQLKNLLCCRLIWGGEERALMKPVDIVSQLKIQPKEGPTHEAGQEEKNELLPCIPSKNSDNDA
jgi:hypothetical protein